MHVNPYSSFILIININIKIIIIIIFFSLNVSFLGSGRHLLFSISQNTYILSYQSHKVAISSISVPILNIYFASGLPSSLVSNNPFSNPLSPILFTFPIHRKEYCEYLKSLHYIMRSNKLYN